ncbi:MAG TPA: HAD family phosphatase [Ruminococcaceae bacterium]|nr:HAD family phosphatase [Oscillospiraceae bacterium]
MNVVFDIGAVLVHFDWDGFVGQMFDKPTADAVTRAMWHNPDWSEFDKALLTDEEILKKFIAKEPDCEKEIRLTFARLGSCPTRKAGAIPLIERLKSAGNKVYYLSNYFEYLMHVAPEVLDFIPHMDGGVFSCFVHEIKPDAAIFNILCQKYGFKPSDAVFIDDSAKNIEGAKACGFRTIHYTGQDFDSLYDEIVHIMH